MGSINDRSNSANGGHDLGNGKKQIFLNAFDMSTVGHLSPGQWKVRKLDVVRVKHETYRRVCLEPGGQVCDQEVLGILDRVGQAS